MLLAMLVVFSAPLLAAGQPAFRVPGWNLPAPPVTAGPPGMVTRQALRLPSPQIAAPSPPEEGGVRPCAVPLVNVLRRSQRIPRMPRYRPPLEEFRMPEVTLPAPSCEDLSRR